MQKKSLLITSALVGITAIGGYARKAYSACIATGSDVLCTGSSAVNTTTQSFDPLNNASLTADPGFGVNAASGNAITVTGDGAFWFLDATYLSEFRI